jgi:Pyruvate/2-oxoacid:ferredoxin oxidoreductase delta subunit
MDDIMQTPSKDRLWNIVYSRTKHGSRHQDEALRMLDGHWQRFHPEIKSIKCANCGNQIDDCVRWTNDKGIIVDSWGYIETDKDICYLCDGSGAFIGDIYLPKL